MVTAWRQEGIKEAHFPPYVNVTFLLFLEVQCHWGLWPLHPPCTALRRELPGMQMNQRPPWALVITAAALKLEGLENVDEQQLCRYLRLQCQMLLFLPSFISAWCQWLQCTCLDLCRLEGRKICLLVLGLLLGLLLFSTAWLSKLVLDFSKTRTITVSQAYHLASQSLASVDSVQEER